MSPIDVIIVSAVALAFALVLRRSLSRGGGACEGCGSAGSCSARGTSGGCKAADDMLRRADEALRRNEGAKADGA